MFVNKEVLDCSAREGLIHRKGLRVVIGMQLIH